MANPNLFTDIPGNDVLDIQAQFPELMDDLCGKVGLDVINKLRSIENKDMNRINVIEKFITYSLEDHLKTTISQSFLTGAGVSIGDITGAYGAGSIQERRFGSNSFGLFFEDLLFGGGGKANSPFADIPFQKMMGDINKKIENATSREEKKELLKARNHIGKMLADSYFTTLKEEFNTTSRTVGSTNYEFFWGAELKSGRENDNFIPESVHVGNITIDEPGGIPTGPEAADQMLMLALKIMYEKINNLLYISYMFDSSESDPAKHLLYLTALDLFHELSIDKVIGALAKKLIKVTGKAKYDYVQSSGLWKRSGAIGRRTYSIDIDLSELDIVLKAVTDTVKKDFEASMGLTRDRLIAAGLYNQHKVMYEYPNIISSSLFSLILKFLDPGENEWVVNPNRRRN